MGTAKERPKTVSPGALYVHPPSKDQQKAFLLLPRPGEHVCHRREGATTLRQGRHEQALASLKEEGIGKARIGLLHHHP